MGQLSCSINKPVIESVEEPFKKTVIESVEEPFKKTVIESVEETVQRDEIVYIDLTFSWDDGCRACLCCDGYSNSSELLVTGSSFDTLQFKYTVTYCENDGNDNCTDTVMVDDEYTSSDMNRVKEMITEIKNSYIAGETYREKMFDFFDSIYELERSPENWNIIMSQYQDD
jgi:hypothetical protein